MNFKLPGKYLGIDVKLNISVLLLVLFVFSTMSSAMITMLPESSNLAIISGSLFISVVLLISVLAHELGHVFVGQKFGVNFNGIILFFLGGAADMSSPIKTPNAEICIAVAGPVVSSLLGASFIGLGVVSNIIYPHTALDVSLFATGAINIAMAIFNLIPAFPMDGGRVLRAFIWKITKSKFKSTLIAGRIGQAFGVVLLLIGFLAVFGIDTPLITAGATSGMWKMFIGGLIIFFAQVEIKFCGKIT